MSNWAKAKGLTLRQQRTGWKDKDKGPEDLDGRYNRDRQDSTAPFARPTPRTGGAKRRASVFVPELAVAREETYQTDEDQPGDIDYEYVMCLMRWCPCMRPAVSEDMEEIRDRSGQELLVRQTSKSLAGRGSSGSWQEVKDTTSGKVYYFNPATQETAWERPKAMSGAAKKGGSKKGRGRHGTQLSMI